SRELYDFIMRFHATRARVDCNIATLFQNPCHLVQIILGGPDNRPVRMNAVSEFLGRGGIRYVHWHDERGHTTTRDGGLTRHHGESEGLFRGMDHLAENGTALVDSLEVHFLN